MTGALIQLIAVGTETMYLHGNPQITFFKSVYRQHTNFALEHTETQFEGNQYLSSSSRTTLKLRIDRTGDLLMDCALVINIPDIYSSTEKGFRWVPDLGYAMIEETRLIIGSSIVQRISGEHMYSMSRLRFGSSKKNSLKMLIGGDQSMNNPNTLSGYPAAVISNGVPTTAPSIIGRKLIIPLDFYFSRDPGMALPLIALQYHEVFIELDLRKYIDLYTLHTPDNVNVSNLTQQTYYRRRPDLSQSGESIGSFIKNEDKIGDSWNLSPTLLSTYCFLDNAERTRFAKANHSYLITYPRILTDTGISSNYIFKMDLFHPIRSIMFAGRRSDVRTRTNQWFNFTNLDEIKTYNSREDEQEYLIAFQIPYSSSDDFTDFVENHLDDTIYVPPLGGTVYREEDIINFRNIWKFRPLTEIPKITQSNYQNYVKPIIRESKLILRGKDRYKLTNNEYFEYYVPYSYFTSSHDGINVYSFSLKPTDIHPAGALNFSQIEKAELQINVTTPPSTPMNYDYELLVMVEEYNILEIHGGMGGLKFAN